MINKIYNLPEIYFIGGETQTLLFNLCTVGGNDFDASNCKVEFALIHYANKNGIPLLVKSAEILEGKNGIMNVASIDMTPDDTLELSGRYVYQLSICDAYNNAEIPGQGIIQITRNIHPEFITK